MKTIILFLLCCAAAFGQSCVVSAQQSGSTVTSFNGWQPPGDTRAATLSTAITTAPSAYLVQYYVDAYPLSNRGASQSNGAGNAMGRQLIPPGALNTAGTGTGVAPAPINTYWYGSGTHVIWAELYDAKSTPQVDMPVATCPQVTVTFTNTWPLSTVDNWTSTGCSTAVTATWSGTVSCTMVPSISSTYTAYGSIDGVIVNHTSNSFATTFYFVTTLFPNGVHNVCPGIFTDTVNGTNFIGDSNASYNGYAFDPCFQVTFSNSNAPMSTAVNTAAYLTLGAPAGGNCNAVTTSVSSCTLTPSTLNTDGTTTAASSSTTYQDANSAIASISATSGTTSTVTAVAAGNTTISTSVPIKSGTDLVYSTCCGLSLSGSPNYFVNSLDGWTITITSSTDGWTPGTYVMAMSNGYATIGAYSGSNLSGGSYSLGPTTQTFVGVWTANTTGCGEINGTPHSSYNAACINFHKLFDGGTSLNLASIDAPFSPGAASTFSNSHMKVFEWGLGPGSQLSGTESSSQCSSIHSSLVSNFSAAAAIIATMQGASINFLGDWMFHSAAGGPYDSVYGGLSACSTGAIYTDAITQAGALGYATSLNPVDEYKGSSAPLQGPTTFATSSPASQNWLNGGSISSNGSGACTLTYGSAPPWGNGLFNGQFLITNSVTTNMNTTTGNLYSATGGTTSGFNFTCTGVASGTYNVSNDPNLTIIPWTGWYGTGANTPAPYDVFAKLYAQYAGVSTKPLLGACFAGQDINAGAAVLQAWAGNPLYTQTLDSQTQAATMGCIYVQNGARNYIRSRASAYSSLGNGWLKWTAQTGYASGYSPTVPNAIEVSSDSGNFWGQQGDTPSSLTVTSCTGNTITFSAALPFKNFTPGISRFSNTGATDSGGAVDSCNGLFFITGFINSTTATVRLAGMDFTGNGSQGLGTGTPSLTWDDMSTSTLTDMSSQTTGTTDSCGNGYIVCGNFLDYTGSPSTFSKHIGHTFTVAGYTGTTANATCIGSPCSWVTRTFILNAENTNPTNSNLRAYYSEIPILAATGGTPTFFMDQNYIKGPRNWSFDPVANATTHDLDPGWTFLQLGEGQAWHFWGSESYQFLTYNSGWSAAGGLSYDPCCVYKPNTFSSGTNVTQQAYANIHFEDNNAVPQYHANNSGSMVWDRLRPLWDSRLPSPYCNPYVDCYASFGPSGFAVTALNVSDGPETITINTTPYLQSGQNFYCFVGSYHYPGPITIVTAGTTSYTFHLLDKQGGFCVFPFTFAGTLTQPTIPIRLANGGSTATDVVIRWSYDPYYLPITDNSIDCGSGSGGIVACTPPLDLGFNVQNKPGNKVWYYLVYRDSSGRTLAQNPLAPLTF